MWPPTRRRIEAAQRTVGDWVARVDHTKKIIVLGGAGRLDGRPANFHAFVFDYRIRIDADDPPGASDMGGFHPIETTIVSAQGRSGPGATL
jgi:hypothetical protein